MDYIKTNGLARGTVDEEWQDVVCFVSYDEPDHHRRIVEELFKYHLPQKYQWPFMDPHNIGRAILLYHYFSSKHQVFKDKSWEPIGPDELPGRKPDAEGRNYKLWVDKAA
jgi:hypothetical protein